MAIANINSVNLYYEDIGIGDPIIFQHGYTASHDGWSGVVERMSTQYRCVAMDCRGAGDSAHPEDGYTIEQLAADVVGMADYLGFDRFHYAGQSMGGLIGFELGLSYPDRLLSLSLSAPAPADGIAMPQSIHATMRERWANKERDLLIRTSLAWGPTRKRARRRAGSGGPTAIRLGGSLRRLLGCDGRLSQGRSAGRDPDADAVACGRGRWLVDIQSQGLCSARQWDAACVQPSRSRRTS